MAKAKPKPRRYSDGERSDALAALAANGGNVKRTAKALGIPEKTLANWAKGDRHPEAARAGEEKKGPLADQFQQLAEKLLCVALDKAHLLNAKDAVVAAAVAVDKMRLLRNEATQIDEHRDATPLTGQIERLAGAFALAAAREEAGGVRADGAPKPVDPSRR
jgi:transposase-like protein